MSQVIRYVDVAKKGDNILTGQYAFFEQIWKGLSQDAKKLIQKMLIVEPDARKREKTSLTKRIQI